jgi:cytochrome c-type biogenesis protein CcmH/NrfG
MRLGDTAKAAEAFKEAIAVDDSHVRALLGFGVIELIGDRIRAAESFLKAGMRATRASAHARASQTEPPKACLAICACPKLL